MSTLVPVQNLKVPNYTKGKISCNGLLDVVIPECLPESTEMHVMLPDVSISLYTTIDEAFNAGLMSETGILTSYTLIVL